jgi:hypothetical protein
MDAMKAYWRSEGIAPHILDLGTRWRWVVTFTSWPLYPQEKSSWYPLDRRLGGPQSQTWWGEKYSALTGIQAPNHPAHSPVLCHWALPAHVYIYYAFKFQNNISKICFWHDMHIHYRDSLKSACRGAKASWAPHSGWLQLGSFFTKQQFLHHIPVNKQ